MAFESDGSVRMRRASGRWIALVAVLVVLAVGVRLADKASTIYAYRVIDDHALAILVTGGPWTWIRVTGIEEASSSVTISVSSIAAPLPGYGGDRTWLAVNLHDPIGQRPVIDAATGGPIPLSAGP